MTTLPFISRRSTVYGTHAIVSSSQPLATQAGIEILKKGGNAADAAVAVAAALNVTEPGSTGIGGDAFCLFYDAKSCTVKGLNGSGRTPASLTLSHLREKEGVSGYVLPSDSIHAVTVPGAAAAWVDTVEHFGSGKLDLSSILAPAIELAEHGFPVSHISANGWKAEAKKLLETNPNQEKNEWLIDNKRAPEEGEIMSIPTLAETFRTLGAEGKKGFYQGRIGHSIIDAVQSRGGLMTLDDLAQHTSELLEPISFDYHDWTVWEIPPNGQGITALLALGIIEALEEAGRIDFSKIEHNSAEYIHIVSEALRIAFADTRYYVADPQVQPVPTEALLSKEYLRERAKLFDPSKRNEHIIKGYPEENGNTVYLSIVDQEGNACSFINSTFMHFGSHIIADNTGVVLHNRGCNFVLIEDHPNCIAPSKRPYHTIIPSMITRKTDHGHDLEACFGVMGAFMQPQGQVQVVLNMKHYLSNPQHALDLPRLCIAPPKNNPRMTANAYSFTEDGITKETIQGLEAKGHTCYTLHNHARAMFGRGQIIRSKVDKRTGHRVLAAGSDPRGDGCATGW
ncbi:gamma-glutamyltranspeptidase [Gilbertella persicaria]|uniref:gamma-glutamyltranspeptidase n=1 Tax=Gilbertella persicaria TaxID=101096 RepID=UPI00221EBBEC|nr:gamma-glutamyltranspeptidase [Gilbertella persicaria]KAI8078984.1 gamma-glutamyltranspeptidase [Gilbertella persicaria]